jgi:hypothetical protein
MSDQKQCRYSAEEVEEWRASLKAMPHWSACRCDEDAEAAGTMTFEELAKRRFSRFETGTICQYDGTHGDG